MPASASRVVSMHDPDARAIAKGRLGKPVEFGYKAQVADNADGVIVDHSVHQGNPADAPLLAPAIKRVKDLVGNAPRAVSADRSYGEAKVEDDLAGLGVKTVVIPRKGKRSADRRKLEHSRGFTRLVKWRTGSEGRIAYLKRRYGWDRTLLDGLVGIEIWCGLGVMAHNAAKIAVVMDQKHTSQGPSGKSAGTSSATKRNAIVRDDDATSRRRRGAGPPGPPPPTLPISA